MYACLSGGEVRGLIHRLGIADAGHETGAGRTLCSELVTDERALAQLDSKLSERAVAWGSLTKYSLEKALDAST